MARLSTWNAIGKDVKECTDLSTVLEKSGLNYTVEKHPVLVDMPDGKHVIPNRFVTTRSTDGHIYDVISDKFEIVQNGDAFDFVNYMSNEIEFEKAGETASGMVYIIAKLPTKNILGDKFIPHVIFRNGFTGKVKISAAICPLRVVCQNQFNFAFKNSANTVNVRHVGNIEAKLEEAREILKVSADYMTTLDKTAQALAKKKITQAGLGRILDVMFPMENKDTMNPYKLTRLESARDDFMQAYDADDNYQFWGTGWGVVNAYTDFVTHREAMGNTATKEEGKFMTTTFKTGLMNNVLDAIEMAA